MSLAEKRRALLEKIDAVETASDVLDIQLEIAAEIVAAERSVGSGAADADDLKVHTQRLRVLADSLVWRMLQPHAIRQLAKNDDTRQSLSTQGAAFDNVLAHAREYVAQTGLPVLLADITNVLRIGDIVLVNDAAKLTIIEVKSKLPEPKHLMEGRLGRQVSRAIGTSEYLHEDIGRVFGDTFHSRLAMDSTHKPEHHWSEVEAVCTDCLQSGRGYRELDAGDYVWAVRAVHLDETFGEAKEKARDFVNGQIGTSLGLMNGVDGLLPPPGVWPISFETRLALLEEDVILVHLLSYDRFAGDFDAGKSIDIRTTDYPVVVTVGGQEYPLSRRFMNDVVYGFETIDSCRRGLLEFAEAISRTLPVEVPEIPTRKPSVWSIETVDDADSLADRDDVPDKDLAALPRALHAELHGAERGTGDTGLAVMRVEELRRLIGWRRNSR